MATKLEEHLGDEVHAVFDGQYVILVLELSRQDGGHRLSRIPLSSSVIDKLRAFKERAHNALKEESNGGTDKV